MSMNQPTTASTEQPATIVGVFADKTEADRAVDDLYQAGFRDDQIGVAMRHDEGLTSETTSDGDTHVEAGAVTGALAGSGLGALAGLGVLTGIIPVVGPAIAAGTLGVILSNAAAGAGIVGLAGALIGAGIPEHEAKYYQDELESGRIIITVTAGKNRIGQAATILFRSGAYDMTTRDAMTQV
jgi:hypothetical protein